MSERVYAKDAGWKDMASAGIIPQAGNAEEYETGTWRTYRPVRDNEECVDCLQCWIYCPDNAIRVENEQVSGTEYDLKHCKGCGICADICPVSCIEMKPESEFEDE